MREAWKESLKRIEQGEKRDWERRQKQDTTRAVNKFIKLEELIQLRAELERKDEALREIVNAPKAFVYTKQREIARKALEEKPCTAK